MKPHEEAGPSPRGPADPGRGGPDHPRLVPGDVLRPREDGPWLDPWRRVSRNGRDWVVDALAVVLAAFAGFVFFMGDPDRSDESTAWLDVSLGVVCVGAVWLRRRFPLELGVLAGTARVGRGQSNAEVAGRLYMSEATVKAHISRVLAKLEVANRVQVALLVHDAGLV